MNTHTDTSLSTKKCVSFLIFCLAFLCLCHIITAVIISIIGMDKFPGDDLFCRMFNMDKEANIPTWFQTTLLFFAASLAFYTSAFYSSLHHRARHFWRITAAILAFLSVDELCSLHERIRSVSHADISIGSIVLPAHFVWIIPGTVAVIIVAIILLRYLKDIPSKTRNFLIIAAAVYLSGALGAELISALTWSEGNETTFSYLLLAGMEETMETAGVIIVCATILHCLSKERARFTVKP